MAGNQTASSDMGVGLSVLFTLVAVAGAGMMFAVPSTETAAWGFALAILGGVLAISASHLYAN